MGGRKGERREKGGRDREGVSEGGVVGQVPRVAHHQCSHQEVSEGGRKGRKGSD